MGRLTTGTFVDHWVRGQAGEIAFRLAGKTPDLWTVKTVYGEAGWYEEPGEPQP